MSSTDLSRATEGLYLKTRSKYFGFEGFRNQNINILVATEVASVTLINLRKRLVERFTYFIGNFQ